MRLKGLTDHPNCRKDYLNLLTFITKIDIKNNMGFIKVI